jgi:hypothetical protein
MTECNHRIRGVIICDQFILRIDPSAKGGGQEMAFPLRAGETLAVYCLDQIFGDLIDVLQQIDGHAAAKCRNSE